MATTEAQFSVPPERVFAVLSDPESYAEWVVGSHSIRDADPDWPAVGARFHHRVGAAPLTVLVCSPGGFEDYFRAAAVGDEAAIADVSERFGYAPVG